MVALASRRHGQRHHPSWTNVLDESGRWAATAACAVSTERSALGARRASKATAAVVSHAMVVMAVRHNFVAREILAAAVASELLATRDNAMEGGAAQLEWRRTTHFHLPSASRGHFQFARVRHGCIVRTSSRIAQADVS